MSRDRLRLLHIRDAIDRIRSYVGSESPRNQFFSMTYADRKIGVFSLVRRDGPAKGGPEAGSRWSLCHIRQEIETRPP